MDKTERYALDREIVRNLDRLALLSTELSQRLNQLRAPILRLPLVLLVSWPVGGADLEREQ